MRYAIIAVISLLAPLLAWGQGAPPSSELCQTCHGKSGPSPYPTVPTIHGLPEVVIEIALYDFRGHTRPCRKGRCSEQGKCPDMDMCAVAEHMTHEDMEVLAVWYASQDWVPASDSYNPALAARGKVIHAERCEICHTGGGTDPRDEASILRGQRTGYLERAFADYREGRRTAVAAMDAKIKALSDEEVAALIAYYASPVEGGG